MEVELLSSRSLESQKISTSILSFGTVRLKPGCSIQALDQVDNRALSGTRYSRIL